MSKPSQHISPRDRRQGLTKGVDQSIPRAGLGGTQRLLDFGPAEFDGVQVTGRILLTKIGGQYGLGGKVTFLPDTPG